MFLPQFSSYIFKGTNWYSKWFYFEREYRSNKILKSQLWVKLRIWRLYRDKRQTRGTQKATITTKLLVFKTILR